MRVSCSVSQHDASAAPPSLSPAPVPAPPTSPPLSATVPLHGGGGDHPEMTSSVHLSGTILPTRWPHHGVAQPPTKHSTELAVERSFSSLGANPRLVGARTTILPGSSTHQ